MNMCLNESNQFNLHYTLQNTNQWTWILDKVFSMLITFYWIHLRLVTINWFAWLSTPQKAEGMTQDTLRKQASSKRPSCLLNNLDLKNWWQPNKSCYGLVRMVAHLFLHLARLQCGYHNLYMTELKKAINDSCISVHYLYIAIPCNTIHYTWGVPINASNTRALSAFKNRP